MSTFHFHQTTTSTPEQFIAGLTDFGPGRSEIFGNSEDDYLEVYSRGDTEADVRRAPRESGSACTTTRPPQPRRPHDHRFQRLGRRVGPHLRLEAAPRWKNRGGPRHRARGQEPQGTDPRVLRGDRRKGTLRKAFENSVKAVETRNDGGAGRSHDIEYAYRDLGDGDVPVVLLQHFRGNLDNWDPRSWTHSLPDRRVVTFDNVGVAATTGTTPTRSKRWPTTRSPSSRR